MLCVKQVFPELVAQVHIYFFKSAFAVNEVVEVLIDKSPFLVMLAELLPVILQKVRFVLAFVEEIVPFIYDGFESPAPDCFGLSDMAALKSRSRWFFGLA